MAKIGFTQKRGLGYKQIYITKHQVKIGGLMAIQSGEGQKSYKKLIEFLDKSHSLATNVFWVSLDCYAEATRCFDNSIIEASMIMCRNSLDSAIVESSLKRISSNPITNYAEWDSRNLFGDDQDFWTVWMKSPEDTRRLLETYALNKIRGIKWSRLRQLTKYTLHLDKFTVNKISKVREMGNFSAHRAQNIVKSSIDSLRTSTEAKIRTKPEDALQTIIETEKLLEIITSKYFNEC